MSNILLFNWNNILTDVINELVKRGHTMLPLDGEESTFKKADVIVLWNEVGIGNWRDFAQKAKDLGKRTVLVQHGRRGTSRIYPPFNETLISDRVCVWGENDKKRLMSVGVSEDRIVITGTPIMSHLQARKKHEGVNVVFSPEHWDRDVTENFIVADELRKLKNVTITTKTLKGYQDDSMYENPISSDRNSLEHLEIVARVLSTADLVVALSESTFELLAEVLNIPVVIANIWIPKSCDGDERYKEYRREYSDACTKARLGELIPTIQSELKNPDRLRRERKEIAILDGGVDIFDPIGNIMKVIETV